VPARSHAAQARRCLGAGRTRSAGRARHRGARTRRPSLTVAHDLQRGVLVALLDAGRSDVTQSAEQLGAYLSEQTSKRLALIDVHHQRELTVAEHVAQSARAWYGHQHGAALTHSVQVREQRRCPRDQQTERVGIDRHARRFSRQLGRYARRNMQGRLQDLQLSASLRASLDDGARQQRRAAGARASVEPQRSQRLHARSRDLRRSGKYARRTLCTHPTNLGIRNPQLHLPAHEVRPNRLRYGRTSDRPTLERPDSQP
jgi:hypothetical protein